MPRNAKIEDDPGSEEAKLMPTPKTGVYAVIALLKRHRVAKRQRRNDECRSQNDEGNPKLE
jgi:hypothetical protein